MYVIILQLLASYIYIQGCMHHNFRNVSIIIWDWYSRERQETGGIGWGKQFHCGFLHFLEVGSFRKFMESVLSSFPNTTPVPRQSLKINNTVSMWNFTDHQKHFLYIFKFVHPVPLHWRAFSSQTWKVKVRIRWMLERYNQFKFLHSQINPGVSMLEF